MQENFLNIHIISRNRDSQDQNEKNKNKKKQAKREWNMNLLQMAQDTPHSAEQHQVSSPQDRITDLPFSTRFKFTIDHYHYCQHQQHAIDAEL